MLIPSKVIVSAASSVFISTTATYLSSWSFLYLCVPLLLPRTLQIAAWRSEDVTQYNSWLRSHSSLPSFTGWPEWRRLTWCPSSCAKTWASPPRSTRPFCLSLLTRLCRSCWSDLTEGAKKWGEARHTTKLSSVYFAFRTPDTRSGCRGRKWLSLRHCPYKAT